MGKRSFWQSLRNNKWLISTGMLAAGALAVYGVWQIPSLNQYHMETLESPATDEGQNGNTKEENTNTENIDSNTEKNQENNGFDLPRDTENQEDGEGQGEEQKKEQDILNEGTSKENTSEGNTLKQQEEAENISGNTGDKKQESKQKKTKEKTEVAQEKTEQTSIEVLSNPQSILNEGNFDESAGLSWPIQGDIILNYDTEGVVYFQTLAQYKANPAIMIAGEEGKKVKASAAGIVTEIVKNEETGITLKTSVGNSYEIIYGQLQDLKVCEGDQIKEGTVLGTLAEPTDYYVVEGPNLYFQILQDGTPVNPLLLLK